MFQSPIGTNKTEETERKEVLCIFVSIPYRYKQNPWQKTLKEVCYVVSIPYRYKQNEEDYEEDYEEATYVSIPYRYKQNKRCICLIGLRNGSFNPL